MIEDKKELTEEQVKHIARLARLPLTDKEVKKFQKQLSETLDYVRLLEELSTEQVALTSQVTGLNNAIRKDQCGKTLPVKDILEAASQTYKQYFKVKGVFQDE